jgi:NhaP-type Na+/H+ and K+/H+ antiporter
MIYGRASATGAQRRTPVRYRSLFAANCCTIDGLQGLPSNAWISLVVRGGRILVVAGGTYLRAGDEVLVVADPGSGDLAAAFENRRVP